MKKKIIFAIFIIALGATCFAQNNIFNVRIGYSKVGGAIETPFANYQLYSDYSAPIPSGSTLTVDADLLPLSPRLSFGGYVEIGRSWAYDQPTLPILEEPSVSFHYGINLSYRMLDLSSEKWDLRLNGSLGSYWCPHITTQVEYGLGAMLAYYPFKHFGLFGELSWGSYLCSQRYSNIIGHGNTKAKVGISYRF